MRQSEHFRWLTMLEFQRKILHQSYSNMLEEVAHMLPPWTDPVLTAQESESFSSPLSYKKKKFKTMSLSPSELLWFGPG